MWSAGEIVVISDLHLAAERGQGLFQADEQLAEFLRWVHGRLRHCHLLLNGDVFDFLVSKRGVEEISLDGAAAEAEAILNSHEEVFEALSLIANSEEHRLTILGGNHDPEAALPTVQQKVERSLNPPEPGGSKPVCSHPPLSWLTNGEGISFQFGGAKVLVEHGDQYDSWNWIKHENLRRVICLASRGIPYDKIYAPPPGSQLVLNRFNRIRHQFPWLETLQPFSAVVLPLALEVILPAVSEDERSALLKAVKEVNRLAVRSAVEGALLALDSRRKFWADGDEERQLFNEWVARYEREEDVWGVVDGLKERLARAAARLRSHAVKLRLKSVSGRNTFFDFGAEDENSAAAAALLENGADLVVHGHTHAAKAFPIGRGLYLNAGTWGRLSRLPDADAGEDEWYTYIEGLRAGRAETFQRLTFVRISGPPEGTTAALCEWVGGGARELSTWRFEGGKWEVEN